jgi:hypothetical protein
MQSTRTRRSCVFAQKNTRLRAGQRSHCAAPCSARSLGGRPRARQWSTRPPLRGCYWSAWQGARRPLRPQGPRPWLLKPPEHRPRASCPCPFRAWASWCMSNLVAVTSSNLNVTLGDSTIRQMALRTPPGGFMGLANRAARAANAGPRAAAHTIASPAVYTCHLSRKAALWSGAQWHR